MVSAFIFQQGAVLTKVAMLELLDAGVDAKTQKGIEDVVNGVVDGKELLGVRNIRGVKSGGEYSSKYSMRYCAGLTVWSGQMHLDLTISVPAGMSVRDSHEVEQRVREAIMQARKEVREVKFHVHGQEEGERVEEVGADKPDNGRVRSDFGGEC